MPESLLSNFLGEGELEDAKIERIKKKWLNQKSKAEVLKARTCFECGGEVNRFKDDESKQMYEDTGYCQVCQDQME